MVLKINLTCIYINPNANFIMFTNLQTQLLLFLFNKIEVK